MGLSRSMIVIPMVERGALPRRYGAEAAAKRAWAGAWPVWRGLVGGATVPQFPGLPWERRYAGSASRSRVEPKRNRPV